MMCLCRYQTENMHIPAIMMSITERFIQDAITADFIIQEDTAPIPADTAVIPRRTAAIRIVRSAIIPQIHTTAIHQVSVSQAFSQEAPPAAV